MAASLTTWEVIFDKTTLQMQYSPQIDNSIPTRVVLLCVYKETKEKENKDKRR